LLVIHDRGDREVPLDDAIRIVAAWPGAQLLETTGLGHHRLLRDARVVGRAVDFLVNPDRPGGTPVGSFESGRQSAR
jgi:hypothetical protein